MLRRYARERPEDGLANGRRGDALLSLMLPAAVILLGVALSVGATGGFDAFADFCVRAVGLR